MLNQTERKLARVMERRRPNPITEPAAHMLWDAIVTDIGDVLYEAARKSGRVNVNGDIPFSRTDWYEACEGNDIDL